MNHTTLTCEADVSAQIGDPSSCRVCGCSDGAGEGKKGEKSEEHWRMWLSLDQARLYTRSDHAGKSSQALALWGLPIEEGLDRFWVIIWRSGSDWEDISSSIYHPLRVLAQCDFIVECNIVQNTSCWSERRDSILIEESCSRVFGSLFCRSEKWEKVGNEETSCSNFELWRLSQHEGGVREILFYECAGFGYRIDLWGELVTFIARTILCNKIV